MKCDDIQELFGIYFDLPDDDLRRKSVDEHILRCRVCAEEFEIWSESMNLIRSMQDIPRMPRKSTPIADKVMNRIYEDESWRIPVTDRIYQIPYKLRRNLTAIIALCLAVFVVSFLFNLIYPSHITLSAEEASPSGFNTIASAAGITTSSEIVAEKNAFSQTAVASTSALIVEPIKLIYIHTPNYWLALSLLGLISALLTMNWLSRTRS
ncbi:zf-HC2 domain-containing protein [Paenibacillus psychroresistens]|uniref:Zf-HC2 domain-containing protein n=1 Tax=Paenibacillus psychroresistens TaxID=1778678 RepID=A0A6B8RNC5_9BACL|nr:zf-HC2 domain-containing protein [Paenibacillus psychroresistens]QGQ96858.1 zf-HC2 domain-containing protein [Paenibacillus psychroresistens]